MYVSLSTSSKYAVSSLLEMRPRTTVSSANSWSCERKRSRVCRESRVGDSGHSPVGFLRSGWWSLRWTGLLLPLEVCRWGSLESSHRVKSLGLTDLTIGLWGPISLVISNIQFNRKLSEQFWRIWCFPIQSDRSCTWMPKRRFKDGRRVTRLVLKRLF